MRLREMRFRDEMRVNEKERGMVRVNEKASGIFLINSRNKIIFFFLALMNSGTKKDRFSSTAGA